MLHNYFMMIDFSFRFQNFIFYLIFYFQFSNPLKKVLQNMVNIQTYKHPSQKRISGLAVRCSEKYLFQNSKEISHNK